MLYYSPQAIELFEKRGIEETVNSVSGEDISNSSKSKPRILLVSSEPVESQKTFESRGYEVITSDADNAFSKISEGGIDLVVTYFRSGGPNSYYHGIHVAEEAKIRYQIPVVFLTEIHNQVVESTAGNLADYVATIPTYSRAPELVDKVSELLGFKEPATTADDNSQNLLLVVKNLYRRGIEELLVDHTCQTAKNLIDGSALVDQYNGPVVITDDPRIAEKAGEKCKFILIEYPREITKKRLERQFPGSYILDLTRTTFPKEFRSALEATLELEQQKRILIVDDNVNKLNLYKQVIEDALEERGYRDYGITMLFIPEDVHRELEKGNVAAVVLDYRFDGVNSKANGLQVLEEMKKKEEYKQIPVIFHTAMDSGMVPTAKKLGAYAAIQKSADTTKLVNAVLEAVDYQEKLQIRQSMAPFADGTERKIIERLKRLRLRKEQKPITKLHAEFQRMQGTLEERYQV